MQLSLDPSRDPHRLSITLINDRVKDKTFLQILVCNKQDELLSSMGKWLKDGGEAELIPQMLHLVALAWLYLDAKAVCADASALLAEHGREAGRLRST